MSSPTLTVARVTMISVYRRSSSTWVRPAASAISVLPVPAVPVRVTKSTSGSISRFMAKFCSRLRVVTPQTAFFRWLKSLRVFSTAVLAADLGHPGIQAGFSGGLVGTQTG